MNELEEFLRNKKILNERPINKMDKYIVNKLLQGVIRVPETIYFHNSRKDLEEMLNKYNSIYLKPTKGSEATGVISVHKITDEYIIYHPRHRNKSSKNTRSSRCRLFASPAREKHHRQHARPDW